MGSEDCLYLNVFAPKVISRPLPVLVFIHGGSFKGGSADPNFYGADFLMNTKEVILVTIQYRLGVFGFLAANDVSCKGNFGLKDQSMALEWIHRNIRAFGGEPKSVTLIGQSAGAASVQHQMMSKRSNGLFHRGILFSGSALAFWAIDKNPEVLFRRYATLALITNARSGQASDIVRELRRRSTEQLLQYEQSIPLLHPILFVFKPVIEGHWSGAFILEDPECVWKSGRYEHRSFMTGVTGYEEGAFADMYYNETVRTYLRLNWEASMVAAMDLPVEVLGPIKDYYFGGQVTEENMINVLRVRDRLLDYPMYKTVEYFTRYASLRKTPVNLYLFNFTSAISTSSITNPFAIEGRGASHSDDLLYLFRAKIFDQAFSGRTPESEMKDYFVRLVVDYVKFGNSPLNHVQSCTRQDMERGFCEYLEIQRDLSAIPNRVQVSASKEFDLKMVQFYRYLDKLIAQVTGDRCL